MEVDATSFLFFRLSPSLVVSPFGLHLCIYLCTTDKGIRRGRMTYCYYQGKPTVVPLHACYWYCYILQGR
jgi:hypothetical protein